MLRKIQNIFWPRMGWRRYGRYLMLRLARLSDTNEEIARGLAYGAAISWTPVPGTHFLGAFFIAFITRSSPISALMGTLVGNPWTFPFMWWLAYVVGHKIFGLFGLGVRAMPHDITLMQMVDEVISSPLSLFFPWVCGGIILGFITWPFFYNVALRSIISIRKTYDMTKGQRRKKRRMKD